MSPSVREPRSSRIRLDWDTLLSRRGKRKPRPLGTVGVWVVDTSGEAPPQLRGQPRTARWWLSSPSSGHGGHPQKRFPPTSRMRFVPRAFLCVFKLRAWSTLLWSNVSPGGSATPLPRLQPSLPARIRWATASCSTPGSIPETLAQAAGAESDGSLSCVRSSFCQSRLRETQ